MHSGRRQSPAHLHHGGEVIKLRLQLGAGALAEAAVARLLVQLAGLLLQAGQRPLVLLQVGPQRPQPVQLRGLLPGPGLGGGGGGGDRKSEGETLVCDTG